MDETNPYASPVSFESAAREESTAADRPPGPSAWREGDELVVPAKNAVFPRACALTNRTDGLTQYLLIVSPGWVDLLVAALLLIPFLGLLVAGLTAATLFGMGFTTAIRPWLRRPIRRVHDLSQSVAVILFFSANLLSGVALGEPMMSLLIPGLACYAAALALFCLPRQVLTRVRMRRAEGGVVRIRGVHPEYLDRLPEKDESQNRVWPEETPQE